MKKGNTASMNIKKMIKAGTPPKEAIVKALSKPKAMPVRGARTMKNKAKKSMKSGY